MRNFVKGKLVLNKLNLLTMGFLVCLVLLIIVSAEESEEPSEEINEVIENSIVVADYEKYIEGTRADESCTGAGCHEGIEPISPKMNFACTTCHSGDGAATTINESHDGMYPNPGDLSVVDDTCGKCHPSQVDRIKKSFHFTSAGVISGARYTWGAQDRDSIYANYAVSDDDGEVPEGAVTSFEQIPTFGESGEPVDDYLRNQCLRCHISTEGAKRDGDYRSSGCSACHVVYTDEGGYQGNNPTTNKSDPDNPLKHEITVQIPAEQCIHCHNRGGRTGVSFIGTMESDGYGTPFTEGGDKSGKLHGKYYNHLSPDVHYERGMQCIDCHTSNDVMGDGNIYMKKNQAVEIECVDCHGTTSEYPWDADGKVTTSGAVKSDGTKYGALGGNEFTNIRMEGNDTLILTSKYDGAEHEIPVLKQLADTDSFKSTEAKVAMSSVPHLEALECYACHANWAPQCYGCHAKMDERGSGKDWVSGGDNDANSWSESRSYLRWENPVLGINTEGLVSPFIPGCQVIFTYIDADGNTVELNKIYTTVDGTSGIAHNPIQPHTVSAKPRSCESCHTNPKALGLGTGIYNSQANGLSISFELERIVDEEGNQLQATSHEGARPFNKAEQQKISRVGVCMGCHESHTDPIWETVVSVTNYALDPNSHTAVMGMAIDSITAGGGPVSLFIASSGQDGKVHLKWEFSDSADIDKYEIYWSISQISDVSSLTPNADTTSESYTAEGLVPGSTYYFAIVASDGTGTTRGVAFSNAIPTTTGGDKPDDGAAVDDKDSNLLWVSIFVVIVFLVFITVLLRARFKVKRLQEEHGVREEKEKGGPPRRGGSPGPGPRTGPRGGPRTGHGGMQRPGGPPGGRPGTGSGPRRR